jgi:electron transfer flavoprotein alpha/beta subunit
MRIAALVEQATGPDGPEMGALARLAVAQGVELAAAVGDGTCTGIALDSPIAEDLLREAIAWGRAYNVTTDGMVVRGRGGEELYAAALLETGPFDLVLLGSESHDLATERRGSQIAERLESAFAGPARHLSMQGNTLHVRCEHNEGWLQVKVPLPAVVSCAEGLIDPCQAPPAARALVARGLIRVLDV